MFAHTKSKLDKLIKQGKKSTYPQLLPYLIKKRMNAFAPFVGAGIRVQTMDLDNGLCVIVMPLTRLNRYFDDKQFTGSLMMMTEPFIKVILVHRLGKDYTIKDKSAHIEFFAQAGSAVTARIRVDTSEILEIIELTKTGELIREYDIDIVDGHQKVVATITKAVVITPKN